MEPLLVQSEKKLSETNTLQRMFLFSGLASIVWYVILNIIIPLFDSGYSISSQTVSELSAIDAPTRPLWVILCIPFSLLTIFFGCGVWLSADHSKKLRLVALVIIFDAVIGSFWPPMHKREVIAAGGGTLTDTLHLVWASVHLACMLLMIGVSAVALGKGFRIYSIITLAVFLVFGTLTTIDSKGIETGEPTPYVGFWERINIGAYMLWIVVFAITLLKKDPKADHT